MTQLLQVIKLEEMLRKGIVIDAIAAELGITVVEAIQLARPLLYPDYPKGNSKASGTLSGDTVSGNRNKPHLIKQVVSVLGGINPELLQPATIVGLNNLVAKLKEGDNRDIKPYKTKADLLGLIDCGDGLKNLTKPVLESIYLALVQNSKN